MKTISHRVLFVAASLAIAGASMATSQSAARPQGPCDIYAAAGDACVAAHSTTRALFASYNGPLYQVIRQSDGKTLDIGVVQPSGSDAGGYANAAAQDKFCANTYCWVATIYDQSGHHNDLTQAPRGAFSGPAMGGFNNLPVADMAPVTVMGHKVYGVFIEPGMGLRIDDAKLTAVDDQAEGQYWVINGRHFNNGCCFDYGNAETDSRDDDNGTMETAYFGDATPWYHGNPPGPWVMTDQENNLVGCANQDGTKLCATLPNITWRFVTAFAKGEPHHWTTLGGDSQQGPLQVMFDGPRVNGTYDPMRKQGAILLGNGGDNSNGSQGTFYEGAMTIAGTFPTDATDQQIQANVVSAHYAEQPLSIAPASAGKTSPGLQTFTPGSSQQTTVTFTNNTGAPASGVKFSIAAPRQWSAVASGGKAAEKTFAKTVAPGSSVSATFTVTAGPAAFNGDLVASATWTNASSGAKLAETAVEKVRSTSLVKINEFRAGNNSPSNATNSFIELYNAGAGSVDLSNWSLTEHATQQAIFSSVKIPAGTKLASHGFYLLGLSNSGLSVPARAGDSTLFVRSTSGMKAGDTVSIDTGSRAETRKIASVGTEATQNTTLWEPLPEGPIITIPAGSTNVPVTSTAGFTVGQKIALGYGATYPAVGLGEEKYEIATVTAVGKPGTQAWLGADAAAGSTNIQVTSVANISVGDKIRLDIDSKDHGIETVTVTKVGTAASRSNLMGAVNAGATNIKVRRTDGFAVGDKVDIGTPVNRERVTVTAVGTPGPAGSGIEFTPALAKAHIGDETVMKLGTGLDLAEPLKFNHAANMPFGDRGTGITFTPATAFAHSSNEPVQALGTGITLDKPLSAGHAIDSVVYDAAVTSAGYQGSPKPNQWFGGPALSPAAGNITLRDAAGNVADSLNYGLLVDPWSAEGYQAESGPEKSGCHIPALGPTANYGQNALASGSLVRSAGRYPDGADTDSNCDDFKVQAATTLALASAAGANNIKVASVDGFNAGQAIMIGSEGSLESATIASVGTAGATTASASVAAGTTTISVANAFGFRPGQTITIGSGSDAETGVITTLVRFPIPGINLSAPLAHDHAAGSAVAGTGITLNSALTQAHATGSEVTDNFPTPGAPNKY